MCSSSLDSAQLWIRKGYYHYYYYYYWISSPNVWWCWGDVVRVIGSSGQLRGRLARTRHTCALRAPQAVASSSWLRGARPAPPLAVKMTLHIHARTRGGGSVDYFPKTQVYTGRIIIEVLFRWDCWACFILQLCLFICMETSCTVCISLRWWGLACLHVAMEECVCGAGSSLQVWTRQQGAT